MYKQKKKRKNKQSLLRQHWPIIVAIMLLVGIFTFIDLIDNARVTGPTAVLYLLGSLTSTFPAVGYCVLPFIVIVLAWQIRYRKRSGVAMILGDLGALAILAFCVMVFFMYTFFIYIFFEPMTFIEDRLEYDNRILALVSKNTYDDLGSGRFALYQCDKQGFHCNQVYESDWGYYTPDPASLEYDVETSSISIIVNDEIIHSHPIE